MDSGYTDTPGIGVWWFVARRFPVVVSPLNKLAVVPLSAFFLDLRGGEGEFGQEAWVWILQGFVGADFEDSGFFFNALVLCGH